MVHPFRSRATGSSGSSGWAVSTAARSFPTWRRHSRDTDGRRAHLHLPATAGHPLLERRTRASERSAARPRALGSASARRVELLSTPDCSAPTRARRSGCDLRRGVVTNDHTGTVTLHLRTPDPELFYKLALPFADPVPPGVPMAKPVPLGVPGTGPYMVQSNNRRRGGRAGAQPAFPGAGRPPRSLSATPTGSSWRGVGQRARRAVDVDRARQGGLHAVSAGRRSRPERSHDPRRRTGARVSQPRRRICALPQHAGAALRQPGCAQGGELRGRSRQGHSRVRRGQEARSTCQIIPAGIVGYRPVLPLHAASDGHRRLDGA